jgi:hypothetical protein
MSAYARQFAEQLEKPEIDQLQGLPPTVAIEQRVSQGGGKSTVATVTELWNFIRLLYSKLGTLYCPDCKVPVEKQSLAAIENTIRACISKKAPSPCSPRSSAAKKAITPRSPNGRSNKVSPACWSINSSRTPNPSPASNASRNTTSMWSLLVFSDSVIQ